MSSSLDRDDILSALHDLAVRLEVRGVEAIFVIAGGAALLLEHDLERGATADIDTAIAPFRSLPEIQRVADEIGLERGWADDWLNAKVSTNGFFPEDLTPADSHVIVQRGDVTIRVADPEVLFVMKLHAARPNRDWDDLAVLAGVCGIETREQAVALFESRYPEHPLKPRAEQWLDQYFSV